MIDFCVPRVQDERDATRLKLPAKVTVVTAKDSARKVWNIGQIGVRVLDQHAPVPLFQQTRQPG